ncbi:MFS transporter, partial [Streptomyces daliensis]|nr:MFS transporter [Streptomyces daliensis]
MTVAALADVPESRSGTASGLVSTAREVSGVFGIVVVGVVLARRPGRRAGDGGTPDAAFLDGYETGLRLAALLVLCGSLVALATLRRTGRH